MELRTVVLVGGGHSNVQVLKILATELKKADRIKLILISEYQYAWYSGMMPGAISGLYKPEDTQMDLGALAQWAKAEFIQARMTGLDVDKRLVLLDGDIQPVYYDYLSINIGSVTKDTLVVPGVSDYAIATRPISELVSKIERFEQEHEKFDHVPHVVIVGAGAAGVELAFAFNARFRKKYGDVAITLVTAVEKIGHNEMGHWVSRNIHHSLKEKRIAVYQGKCVKVSKSHVTLESNETRDVPYDLLVWATGADAPTVLKSTGLQLDDRGYLLVSQTLQSLTRPEVFASGDCCAVQNCPWITKAGVYSVREGPFVAQNILKLLRGQQLTKFNPQKGFMALMMTGDGSAISSWKGTSATGKLVWLMKDRIDRKFMDLFNVNKLPTNVVNYAV